MLRRSAAEEGRDDIVANTNANAAMKTLRRTKLELPMVVLL